MRRLPPEDIPEIERVRRERFRHRLIRVSKKARRKGSRRHLEAIRRRHRDRLGASKPRDDYLHLVVPERISFRENYDEVAQFLNDLREAVFVHRQKVFLDFSKVKSISPAATLVLVAEVYRCRHLVPKIRANGNFPADRSARQLLVDMGFYELISVKKPSGTSERAPPDLEHIKFVTSNVVESILAKKLREALTRGIDAIREEARHRMFEGIKEAMQNAIQHAYMKPYRTNFPSMRNRWWMAGVVDKKRNELMVMFYDQGVGIPRTVSRRYPKLVVELREKLGVGKSDGDAIRVAMEIGRTATRQSYRGKGLNDVREFVRICREGQLRILSGGGEYEYNADGTERMFDHKSAIGGTLIQWRVSQSAVAEARRGKAN